MTKRRMTKRRMTKRRMTDQEAHQEEPVEITFLLTESNPNHGDYLKEMMRNYLVKKDEDYYKSIAIDYSEMMQYLGVFPDKKDEKDGD
jgi:hypothetical protein